MKKLFAEVIIFKALTIVMDDYKFKCNNQIVARFFWGRMPPDKVLDKKRMWFWKSCGSGNG